MCELERHGQIRQLSKDNRTNIRSVPILLPGAVVGDHTRPRSIRSNHRATIQNWANSISVALTPRSARTSSIRSQDNATNFRNVPHSFSGALTPRSARTPSILSQNSSSSNRAGRQLEIELRRQEELAELERQKAKCERQIIELRAQLKEAKLIENKKYVGLLKTSDASACVITASSGRSKVAEWLHRNPASADKSNYGSSRGAERDITK